MLFKTASTLHRRNLKTQLGRRPSTLIRHENRDFRKRSGNRANLKTPVFHCRVNGKHFETEQKFRKRWPHDNRDFPDRVFLKNKAKVTSDC